MGSKAIPGTQRKDRKREEKTRLTAKQLVFIDEYMKDSNGSRAARVAGYAPASTNVTASKLLHSASVQSEIQRRMQIVQSSRILSLPEVLGYLTSIATDETAAKSDRVRALELLGKRYAAFVDRSESVQDVTVDSIKSLTTEELRALIAPKDVTPE